MNTLQLNLPQEILEILTTLQNHYEVFLVGGCVRDTLLGKEIHDFDVTTNATTDEMKTALSSFRIIETGVQHGTLTILNQNHAVEITTYRIDKGYQHHRMPEKVIFTHHLSEDLRRRDFTINAIACSLDGRLIDEHHGIEDIQNRVIRCVGDPIQRFEEDALRILRAVRLAHQLDFKIEEQTANAILFSHPYIKSLSVERRSAEFFKMLLCEHQNLFQKLNDYHLLQYYGLIYDEKIHHRLDETPLDLEMRLASLFNSSKHAKKVLQSWSCSKKIIKNVMVYIDFRNSPFILDAVSIRRLIYTYQDVELVRRLFIYKGVDVTLLDAMILHHDYFLKLEINGHDLLNIVSKKQIPSLLKLCSEYCFEDIQRNHSQLLLNYVQKVVDNF